GYRARPGAGSTPAHRGTRSRPGRRSADRRGSTPPTAGSSLMAHNLGRRLSTLEAIAEEVRTRPIRRMVADLTRAESLTPAETDEALQLALAEADRLAAERARLLRAGVSEREILQQYADEMGISLAELEA